MDTHVLYLLEKIAGRLPTNIFPPKSLGDKGIQSVLKDLEKRKKLTKQPLPGPDEVLDRAAGYLADRGFLKKESEEKQARCWNGFEPVPGKEPYSKGSCRPKTQTTKRVNEKVAYILQKLAGGLNAGNGFGRAGGIGGSGLQGAGKPMSAGESAAKYKSMGGGGGGGLKGGIGPQGLANSGATFSSTPLGGLITGGAKAIGKGVSALSGAAMPGSGIARSVGGAVGRGVRSAAGAVGRGVGAAAGAVGRGAMGAFNASPMGMGMRAGQSIGRGIGAAARGIGGAASAAGSAIGKGVSTAYNNSPMGMGARAGKAIGRGIAGAAKGFASGVMGKSGEEIPLAELTSALDKLASAKKKSKKKSPDEAPTLDEINEYFTSIKELLSKDGINIKKYQKPESVKDVPLTSTYREVINAAKDQDIGMVRRHLLAMLSRPAVWGKSNAMFYPKGKHGLVISPKKINKDVLDHEYGHAEDYRRLGGEKGFKKEYHPGFFEALTMPSREYYNRSILLPEARAWHYAGKPVDLSEKNQLRDRAFGSYVNFVDALSEMGLHKGAEATTTVYFASPNRQLIRIPKDAVVSTNPDIAYQMGRFYPETKETWSAQDVSGKWTGGTPQPTFRAGRLPMGRPTLYRAEVNQTDLAVISDMVKSVKKLRRSVTATAVKQKNEKE